MTILRKIIRGSLYITYLILVVIILLEIAYRYQIVDFYGKHLRGLNSKTVLANKENKETLLVLGDSFSASPFSYVSHLKDSLPELNVVNASISGTSIKEASIIIDRRINQCNPSTIIYQIYVGNDLLEYSHPYVGENLSLLRKTYWWLSDRIWVASYINRLLPNLKNKLNNDIDAKIYSDTLYDFDPNKYSNRSKLYFSIDPHYLENTILQSPSAVEVTNRYLTLLRKLIKKIPDDVDVKILPLPHCVQVSEKYISRMETIGCKILSPKKIVSPSYPLLEKINSLASIYSNVEVINPLSRLIEIEASQNSFYNNDPHLNPQGQTTLAQWVIEELLE